MPPLHVGTGGGLNLPILLTLLALLLGPGAAAAQDDARPHRGGVAAPASLTGTHEARLQRQVEAEVHGALLATGETVRKEHLNRADEVARVLVATYPESADAHYWKAVARGVRAEYSGPFAKVGMGEDILTATDRVLALDSLHPGGHEMMGRLHAAVMRLPWLIRQFALRMGMGEVLGDASWSEAERHLRISADEDSLALAPRLELAKLLVERDRPQEAVPVLRRTLTLPRRHAVDERMHVEADSILGLLREDTPDALAPGPSGS